MVFNQVSVATNFSLPISLLKGKAVQLVTDYSLFSDQDPKSERNLKITAKQPGIVDFFTETNMPVLVKPGEKVTFELDVEAFDAAPEVRALPMSKRGCVTELDDLWKLKLFTTYT